MVQMLLGHHLKKWLEGEGRVSVCERKRVREREREGGGVRGRGRREDWQGRKCRVSYTPISITDLSITNMREKERRATRQPHHTVKQPS